MTYLPKYKPEHPMYRESFHIEPTLQHTGELTRAHAGDAGLDLHSTIDFVLPGQSGMRYPKSIPTGVTVAIPRGHVGLVTVRSGLATSGVSVVNSPGIIDSGYRGEISVLLINHGPDDIQVMTGARIAQLVVVPYFTGPVVQVESIPDGDDGRGEGGFGSSGS